MLSLRSAARGLLKAPGFTLTAVLTLGIGIGINTTLFSAVYATLIQPLPFPDSEQLVAVHTMVKRDRWEPRGTSIPDFLDYRQQATKSFASLSAIDGYATFTLTGGDEPLSVSGEIVSHDYFSTLGRQPALGRTFTAEEDSVPDRDRVVVLADGLWRSRYAGDPGILGQTILLNDRAHTVIGVMPPGFGGLSNGTQFWLPLALSGGDAWSARGTRGIEMVGRLRPGATIEQARAELESVGLRLAQAYPRSNTGYVAIPLSLREDFYGDLRGSLLTLTIAVGLVLAITCANVANLLLVRLAARRREIAVRLSLGASPRQIQGLFLTETILLTLGGGALALLVASWSIEALAALNPITLPDFVTISLNGPVLGFGFAAMVVCSFAIGLPSAYFSPRTDLKVALSDGSRGMTGGASASRIRTLLVFGQIAVSLALLVTATLLLRSFFKLVGQQPGYRTEQVVSMRVRLPPQRYDTATAEQFAERLRERAATLPGVASSAITTDAPLEGVSIATFARIEGADEVPDKNVARVYRHAVTPEFFRTAGISLLQGRTFHRHEAGEAPTVAVVSAEFARRFWPADDAVGKRFKLGLLAGNSPWIEIIGVAAEAKYRDLVRNPTNDPDVYIPFAQQPSTSFTLLVNTQGEQAGLPASLRGLIRDLDPNLPAPTPVAIEELIAQASSSQRFSALLMGTFAVTALLLAAIGLYGVVSFSVGQRTREFGVRIALGARPADIYRLILGGAGRLLMAGLAAGILLCLLTAPLIEGLLFELRARDPLTYAGIAFLLAAVALLAAWRPARRATRVDPMVALRSE